jgi:cytochrome P450
MLRKSLIPYTLPDGTTIPAGTLIGIPPRAIHMDPEVYPDPLEFDAERYMRRARQASPGMQRDQLATATPDFLSWSYGRAACPGRFFASTVMKLITAQIIFYYDVSLTENPQKCQQTYWRPQDLWLGPERFPDFAADIVLKKRG